MSTAVLTRKDRIKTVFLSSLGGGLEFYDFIVFAVFAPVLGQTFFPAYSSSARLVGAYAVFAIGYLARPIGGILFSHFGDKYGRKKSFSVSISVMAFTTLLMSLVPTYQQGGIGCTVLFVILRLIQGMSIGGEIPGAITFVSEHIRDRPGGACAIIFLFLKFGILLADGMYILLHSLLSDSNMNDYGWRIAFMFGGLLAVVSYYLRKNLTETSQFLTQEGKHAMPFLVLLRHYPKPVIAGFFITGLNATLISIYLLYLTSYMQEFLNFTPEYSTHLSLFQLGVLSFFVPFFGFLSDYLGRRFLLLISSVLIFFTTAIFFTVLKQGEWLFVFLALNAIIFAVYNGSFPCLISELFPVDVRFSGVALSYNMGFAIFGGLSPLIVSLIIQKTEFLLAPALIIMCSAVFSFISLLFIRPLRL